MKSILKKIVPGYWLPDAVATRKLLSLKKGVHILDGFFKGMIFTWEKWDEDFTLPIAKFIGTYERELVPIFNKMVNQSFDTVVDIGAAEGYYAIGMALKSENSVIHAFESLENGRNMMKVLAEKNQVIDRFNIYGTCHPSELEKLLDSNKKTFILMDIEGAEEELLQPEQMADLKKCTILYEAHECYNKGVGNRINEKFKRTHRITHIPYKTRVLSDAKLFNPFEQMYLKYHILGWMGERLHPVDWFLLEPLS